MRKKLLSAIIILITAATANLKAQSFNINTIAGNGTPGYSGDGGIATGAELSSPQLGYPDDSGNVYIADASNNRLRKVTTTGKIYTIAGNGTGSFAGDSGAATAAELYYVTGVVKDSAGNIYVSDFYNDRIRKIKPNGKIYTIAGTGVGSYNGDGGKAVLAEISHPVTLCLDKKGNLYFADEFNNRIRKIDTGGIITTVAGNGTGGYNGDNIAATAAEISSADGLALDDSDNIYIADQSNDRIRKVNYKTGIITTIAGTGTLGYSGDGAAATAAEIAAPQGVAVDRLGNVYIADFDNNRIRMVSYATGKISTIAGNGTGGFSGDGGAATAASLYEPIGISVDASGNLYVADLANQRVRKLTLNPTAVNELKVDNAQWTIYPNPSNGKFIFQIDNEKQVVEIYNVSGEKIYSQSSILNSQLYIDISNQPKGIYLYRVVSEKGITIATGKLIIQK
ncbi:MAG TPA: T9SS type A sorting domain-containing protein [Bacteroidia bacterium]|nr:T9SS type A sorting domain-containing protein [Bacteroidia bacterium]